VCLSIVLSLLAEGWCCDNPVSRHQFLWDGCGAALAASCPSTPAWQGADDGCIGPTSSTPPPYAYNCVSTASAPVSRQATRRSSRPLAVAGGPWSPPRRLPSSPALFVERSSTDMLGLSGTARQSTGQDSAKLEVAFRRKQVARQAP